MKYEEAIIIANRVIEELRPHCIRCEIAGSVRRRKPEKEDLFEMLDLPYVEPWMREL